MVVRHWKQPHAAREQPQRSVLAALQSRRFQFSSQRRIALRQSARHSSARHDADSKTQTARAQSRVARR
eukprot:3888854-Lingulodinium_polyedra.AAC.1